MATATTARRAFGDRASLYQEITGKIIAELKQGRVPWVQPWGGAGLTAPLGLPQNAATGRKYSGINILILWSAVAERGFSGQRWLTFRQALALGGHVRKGEKGTTVVFADRFIPERERARAKGAGEEPEIIPFLKRFTVFNIDQCEGLPAEAAPPPPLPEHQILPQVEALIKVTGVDLRIGGDRAYYDVTADIIRVPPPQAYFEPINWHRTVLHEMVHYTGHVSRLNRDQSGAFGSSAYSFEEIIAETGCAFLWASLSITPTVRHSDYIGAWLDVLRENDRAIIRAASAASKAADYLLSFLDLDDRAAAEREAAAA